MEKKMIFIDVDGTLVGYNENGSFIPDSAKRAIQQARKNGHLVYLCTGRGMAEIDNDMMAIGFDGIIGAAGGFILENDEIIYHKRMPVEDVKEIMAYLDNLEIAYYLESNSGLYCSDVMYEWMKNDPASMGFLEMMKFVKDANLNDINKISFVTLEVPYEEIENHFEQRFNLVKASWIEEGVDAGEISNQGITKGSAISFLLNHLNISKENTYAFGDSMNDIEMFECVNTSIVMGNSMYEIALFADFETKPLEEDGIEYGMKHFGLI